MKGIIKKLDICDTTAQAGPVSVKYFCDVTDGQLAAAKKYTSYFKQELAVKCTSFVKVNFSGRLTFARIFDGFLTIHRLKIVTGCVP